MKHVFKNSKKVLIMVALLATVMAYANEPSIFYYKTDMDITILTLTSVKKGDILKIKDENGITLFKESIETSGNYNKGFDLTSLPDGDYFFVLDKDLQINSIPFKVASSLVTFAKDKETVTFKPYMWNDKNRLFVQKLALNEELMDITIYYETESGYEPILSETIGGKLTIKRAYKLDSSREGYYKIVCTSEGRTFSKTFKF